MMMMMMMIKEREIERERERERVTNRYVSINYICFIISLATK